MANSVSSNYSYMQTANNRVTGLASGMDTEAIVEKLMKAQSAQMEKLQQQKQLYEWKRDAYRDVNTKLSTFNTTLFDKFGLQGSFSSKSVNISDSTKVSVTATPSATGTLNLQSVSQLATSASKTMGRYTDDATLSDFGINASGTFKYTVNGGLEKSFDYTKDTTLSDLVSELQANDLSNAKIENGQLSLGPANVQVTITDSNSKDLAQKLGFTFNSNKITNPTVGVYSTSVLSSTSKLSELGIAGGIVTLNVLQADGSAKSTDVPYKSTDTLDSFLSNLNKSGAGVTALFSNGKLSLTANATGSATGGAIAVQSDTNGANGTGVFQKLGFLTSATGEIANGQNAKYAVNGLDMESTSNTFTVSGYSVTVKDTFNTSPVTISSSTNVDAMVDKIKEFVKTYNDITTSLNDNINEKKNRDYSPLTDSQRAEMTEDQITKW